MLNDHGTSHESTPGVTGTVFERLGGELSAIDPWTRVDSSWLDALTQQSRDAVGYQGLSAAYRVAGLTLGDADAAPLCPPFIIEILADRLRAQVFWPDGGTRLSRLGGWNAELLHRWTGGSLSKDLRVLRFEDGDIGLEAIVHLGDASTAAMLREFVTAFSWDVAALHAAETTGELQTTEEWIQRAALSISRSTPSIPLRPHLLPDWQAFESPSGVFCSLQPSGGLAESDNVLYAVRRDWAALEPVATMPGHRNDWDYTRLTDVWLARDGQAAFARTLLCTGFVHTGNGAWRPIESEAVTAVALFGTDGFLLGLHDGMVQVLDGRQVPGASMRIGCVKGRFSRLVSVGNRVVGIVGSTLLSARITSGAEASLTVTDTWMRELHPDVAFEDVSEIDMDAWSRVPALAVLGDEAVVILDPMSGRELSRFAVERAHHAKWIGQGWLLVMEPSCDDGGVRTRIRVLDVVSGRWTPPVMTGEVTRLAVRGDEIHVGYANQSIAVWDRAEVCRAISAVAFISQTPGEHGTGAEQSARRCDAQGTQEITHT